MASVTDLKSELEGGDVSRQMQALVVLMNHLSTDREVGTLPSLVCQKVIAIGGVPPPVLRLAYDVIRLANLTTGDWEAICRSIKADLSGQQIHAETAQVVLELIPSVPPPHLVDLVIHQDFGSTLSQFVRHDNPQVRSAAIDAFGACFCLDETLEAMASSPGLVRSTMEWWDMISDAALDSDADTAAAAVYSVEALLSATASGADTGSSSCGGGGGGAPPSSDSFHLRRRQSQRVTQRLLYGLGALLHRVGSLPPGAQVHVSRLLCAALRLLAQAVASECGGAAPDGLGWAAAPSRGSSAREGMGLFGASRPDEVRASGALLVWALQESGRYLYKLLSLTDPAAVAEAAKALLSLASLPIPDLLQAAASPDPSASFAAAADVPAEWTSGSVGALLALWRRQDAGPARHDILLACCRGLPALEPSARSAALPSLLQLSAGLAQSSHRLAVFAHLWHSAVDLDLESQREARTRQSSNSGEAAAAGFPLSALLEHPSVLSIMKAHGSHSSEAASAGGRSEESEAGRAAPGKSTSKARLDRMLSGSTTPREQQPQGPRGPQTPPNNAREELASTLLLTISQHSRAARKVLPPPALTASSSDGGMADAARREKVAEALDWVRAGVLVLRSLSSCLSWDSASLAVPDAWLRLLQRCAAVSRDLTQHGSSPSKTALLRDKAPQPGGAPVAGTAAVEGVQGEFETVQRLLQKLLSDLPHLGAPLKARALWVLVHHLNLHPKEEAVWRALLAQMASLGLGASQSRSQGARLAAAASQQGVLPQCDALPQMTHGSAAGGGDLHDLQSTQMQAVLLCVERLAGLLSLAQYAASSAKEDDEQQGFLVTTAEDDEKASLVPGLAKGLERVLQGLLHSQRAALGPDAVDCCQRVQRQLRLLQEEDAAENDVSGYGLFREEDLMVAEGYPFGKPQASAPSASSPPGPGLDSLVRAAVADAVQSAQRRTLGTAGGDAKAVLERELVSEGLWALGVHPDGAQNSPVPSAAELTASLGGLVPPRAGSAAASASASASLASSGRLGDPQQLTGPSDCVLLVAHHSVHPRSSTVSVHFEVCNPLIFDLEGLVISLGITGPAYPEGRQPNLIWQLPKVEPQETLKWEARLCISGFGRIQLHPRITVAKSRQSGKVSDLSIRAAAYEIPLQHLLQAPSVVVSAGAFFQQWESLPARWEASATAHSLGSGQATALLSAIHNCTPLERVWLRGLPLLGGFQAAYQGFTWSGETVSAVVIAQLLPSGAPSSSDAASAATAAPPSALESGREIVRLVVRSSSHEVIQALEADPGAFVSDLSGGLLSLGLAPPPAVPPLLPPRAPSAAAETEPRGAARDSHSSRPPAPEAVPADLLSDHGADTDDNESQEPGGVAPSRFLLEATQAERIVQKAAMAEWQRLNCRTGAVSS